MCHIESPVGDDAMLHFMGHLYLDDLVIVHIKGRGVSVGSDCHCRAGKECLFDAIRNGQVPPQCEGRLICISYVEEWVVSAEVHILSAATPRTPFPTECTHRVKICAFLIYLHADMQHFAYRWGVTHR